MKYEIITYDEYTSQLNEFNTLNGTSYQANFNDYLEYQQMIRIDNIATFGIAFFIFIFFYLLIKSLRGE